MKLPAALPAAAGSSSGSAGGIYSLFSGRSLTADSAAAYISSHHLDTSALVWDGNRIHLSRDHWAQITDVELNVFVDDGNGFIDLGLDNSFSTEGDDLVSSFDGTWLSIDKQPVAYYFLGTVENKREFMKNAANKLIPDKEVKVIDLKSELIREQEMSQAAETKTKE